MRAELAVAGHPPDHCHVSVAETQVGGAGRAQGRKEVAGGRHPGGGADPGQLGQGLGGGIGPGQLGGGARWGRCWPRTPGQLTRSRSRDGLGKHTGLSLVGPRLEAGQQLGKLSRPQGQIARGWGWGVGIVDCCWRQGPPCSPSCRSGLSKTAQPAGLRLTLWAGFPGCLLRVTSQDQTPGQ